MSTQNIERLQWRNAPMTDAVIAWYLAHIGQPNSYNWLFPPHMNPFNRFAEGNEASYYFGR